MSHSFDCDRTCPLFEKIDSCRFNALLREVGVAITVNSKTMCVEVEIRDTQRLADVVERMGGEVLGEGKHHVGGGREAITGLGINLKCAYGLMVLKGTEIFTSEVNKKLVAELTARYVLSAMRETAKQLEWDAERTDDGIRVHHPDSGHIDVVLNGENEATVEGFNFKGTECHLPISRFAEALGTVTKSVEKEDVVMAEVLQLRKQRSATG